jgi:HAD superfamily hydrolase (TIGR01459 family)
MTTLLKGLAPLVERFDGFVIDQWGVLHDGARPYPGALQALQRLKAEGRRIVLLSNSGLRRRENADRLARLGLKVGESYDALVTSGEVTADMLARRRDPFFANLGRRCLLIGPRNVVDGVGVDIVANAEAADFVLLASTNHPDFSWDETRHLLATAARRGLPLICSNPDLAAVVDGRRTKSPGELARHYAGMGCPVRLIGKPAREVFANALAVAALSPGRIVVIGDSLEHDIAGGSRAGLATVLVMGGIHADDMPADHSKAETALAALTARFGVRPDYAVPTFRW